MHIRSIAFIGFIQNIRKGVFKYMKKRLLSVFITLILVAALVLSNMVLFAISPSQAYNHPTEEFVIASSYSLDLEILEDALVGGGLAVAVYARETGLSMAGFTASCMIQMWIDFDSDALSFIPNVGGEFVAFVPHAGLVLDEAYPTANPPGVNVRFEDAADVPLGRVGTFHFDICPEEVSLGDTVQFAVDMRIAQVIPYDEYGFCEWFADTLEFSVLINSVDCIRVGDIYENHRIEPRDVLMLRAYVMQMHHTLPPIALERIALGAGSVYGAATIQPRDVLMLRAYVMGMRHTLPEHVIERLEWFPIGN